MANIVLLDNEGVSHIYQNIYSATFNTAEGGLVTFKAPDEHNEGYNMLEELLENFSEDYDFMKVDTPKGTYIISTMFDFGAWFVTGGNAYHILESGSTASLTGVTTVQSGIVVCGDCVFIRTYEMFRYSSVPNDGCRMYFHDGEATHNCVYLAGDTYHNNWSWIYGDDNKLLVLYNIGSMRGCIVYYDGMSLPIVADQPIGGTGNSSAYSYVLKLNDTTFLLQNNLPASCGGAIIFSTENGGNVHYLEPFRDTAYNVLNSYTRVSDNVFLLSSASSGTNSIIVLLNTALSTHEVLAANVYGTLVYYHVATNTAFIRSGSNLVFFDLSDNSTGTIGSIGSKTDFIVLGDSIAYICGSVSKDFSTFYTDSNLGPGYSVNYGFSILNFSARTLNNVETTGHKDWSSLYYEGGALALVITSMCYSNGNGNSAKSYSESAYAVNVNTGDVYQLKYDNTNISNNIRIDGIQLARNMTYSSSSYIICAFVRPNVFFTASDCAYITFQQAPLNKRLFKCELGNFGALTSIYEFANQCAGYTIGGSIRQDIIQFIDSHDTLESANSVPYLAFMYGANNIGTARLYSSTVNSISDKTCVLIRPNKPAYVYTKQVLYNTSYFGFCNLCTSIRPIKDSIYAGYSGNGQLFLVDIDNDNDPIKSTFIYNSSTNADALIKNSATSSGYSGASPLYYNGAQALLLNTGSIRIADAIYYTVFTWPSTVLLSDDLGTYFGYSQATSGSYPYGPISLMDSYAIFNTPDAFDLTGAEVLYTSGEISSDNFTVHIQSKFEPKLIFVFGRLPNGSSSRYDVSYHNCIGVNSYNSTCATTIRFIANTASRYLFARLSKTIDNNYKRGAIFAYNKRAVESYNAVSYKYNYGYNWTEVYPSSVEGNLEILRPGLPRDRYLLWDEAAKTITEVIVSDNNE